MVQRSYRQEGGKFDLYCLFVEEAEDNCQEEVLGTARVETSIMAHHWVHKLPEA